MPISSLALPTPPLTFDGLLASIENDHKNDWTKFIKVTGSPTLFYDENRNLYNIVNVSYTSVETGSNWCSNGTSDKEHFIITFPKHIITPVYFTMVTKTTDLTVVTAWYVEGSLDGKKWTTIGSYKDEFQLEVNHQNKTFAFQKIDKFRHIRFTQTDAIQSENHIKHFCLRRIELFGELCSNCMNTVCINKFSPKPSLFIYVYFCL